jgi:D-alanine transaminase
VLELCSKNKIDFSEEYIKPSEIKTFDEFFITGTITEIMPIVQIDDWVVGDGKPGILTRTIQETFFKAVNKI